MNQDLFLKLKAYANQVRIGIINQVFYAQSGHIGGSLSCTDILTVLYFHEMNIDPENPDRFDRDRFILSKGHCSPALYAVLAERGFFNRKDLLGFRKPYSFLQGHPCMDRKHGIEMSTGSLGQGISIAVGKAIAGKIYAGKYRVYCILGDGELQEGQVWEALMAAAHYNLDNLCVIVDNNGLQIDGAVDEIMSLGDIAAKFLSFGWSAAEINGHDITEIIESFENARTVKNKPSVIIAKTIKGKGVSFMENSLKWHGTAPDKEERSRAIEELTGIS